MFQNDCKQKFLMRRSLKNVVYDAGTMAGRPPTKEAPLFGQRMAALRQARGLSQTELATRLNMNRAMITYYERKATNPTSEIIQKVADALGVGVHELLGGGSAPRGREKPGPASQIEQQIEQVRRLPRSKQKFVVEFLETF